MKWSPILHGIAAITGVVGLLTLIWFWVAAWNAGINPFSPEHLYDDTIALLLVSIAFGIGALIHQKEESSL